LPWLFAVLHRTEEQTKERKGEGKRGEDTCDSIPDYLSVYIVAGKGCKNRRRRGKEGRKEKRGRSRWHLYFSFHGPEGPEREGKKEKGTVELQSLPP